MHDVSQADTARKCARRMAKATSDTFSTTARAPRRAALLHQFGLFTLHAARRHGGSGLRRYPRLFGRRMRREQVTTKKAILAGGCFWGMQDLIRKLPGVISTRVGYTGGENPTRRTAITAMPRDRNRLRPCEADYRELLEFFFQIHDPTHQEPAGQRRRHALPLGDLLPRRGTEALERTPSPMSTPRGCGRARWSPK